MSVVVALSLLHFVWQGALIGAVAWVAMKLTRSANARYAIGVVALALMAAAPVVTARLEMPAPAPPVVAAPVAGASVESPMPTARVLVATPPEPWWTQVALTPLLAERLLVGWIIGVAFLSLRLIFGWMTARRLTRVGVTEPRLEILSHAERIMGALNIQHAVTVLESALVKVPMTMGWWKPVVLLPAAAMTGLSMEQIYALVAHELAHVRRHDYLVNLAQSAIETLLFYHPMVWVISRAVRHERELCCDDLAIAVCGGDTVTYASALADLESMRVAAPALAANGGSLLLRVRRILGHDAAAVSRSRTNWAAGVAIIVTAMLLVPMNVAKTRADERAQTAQGVVGGVKGGVTNGVTEGVATGMPGGVAGGVSPGAAAGVKQGVTGGVPGGIVGIDPLPPAIDFTRLASERPTAVGAVGLPPSPRIDARTDQRERLGANDDRFTPETAEAAAKTVPMFATDDLVVSYLLQLDAKRRDREAKVFQFGYGPNHPVTVQIDGEVKSLQRQLFMRMSAIAELKKTAAVVAADRSAQAAIAPGHLLRLEVSVGIVRQTEFSGAYTVQPDGFIVLPYVGRAKVAGLTIDGAQESIRALLNDKGTLPGAKVVASLEGRSSDTAVFVLGEVNAPNAYPWREGLTVAQAISLAGGAKTAGLPVELLLSGGTVDRIGDLSKRVPVGASVNVLAFRNIVMKVQGAVVKPGNLTLREDHVTLPDVLTAAGGLTPSAGTTIRLKRAAPGSPAAGVEVENGWELYSVAQLRNGLLTGVVLSGGDTVDVPVAPKYYVQGFVNSPGEIQWEPNLTLQRAIFKAGGATKDGAMNRLSVKRLDPQTKKYDEVDLGKDPMTVIVQPNDVITVPKKRL